MGLSDENVFEENLKRLNNYQRSWVNKYFQNDFKLFGYEKLKLLRNETLVDLENNIFL